MADEGAEEGQAQAPIAIFGATGGVGSALARRLVRAGGPVVLIARDGEALEELGEELGAPTVTLEGLDDESMSEAVDAATGEAGLGGLVYAIGSIDLVPFNKAKDDQFTRTYELNVLGAVRALRAAEKPLKQAQGAVLLFSTIAVQAGFPNHTVISTAKGAIEALTRSLAAEWAPKVRVNAIAPSLLKTRMAQPILGSEKMADAIAGMHPIPRLGEPEDVAALGAALLARDAGWVTGQIMHVDGGRSTVRHKG